MLTMVIAMLLAAGPQAEPKVSTTEQAAPAQPDAVDQLLQQAIVDVRAGHNAEALIYLDPMAASVIDRLSKAQFPIYCAQSSSEAKGYLGLATPAAPTVRLVQPRLCQILFVRAYALENLHRVPEALDQLRKLISFEPNLPHFQVEYASALRQSGDNDAALATYWRAVEIAAPVKEYGPDQAAALRGIGFILTERGDLAGAEKAYHQSLDLMPGHPIAIHELAYIAHLRATGAKTAAQTMESSTNPAILPMPTHGQ